MRLFYASFLDSQNMRAYEALVAETSQLAPGAIRPIPARSHHLTMAFLGEVPEGDLNKCLEVLAAVEDSRSFDFSLGQPRILYARRTPRLVCADVEKNAQEIVALQALLRKLLLQRFPDLQLRAHSPHVTLARFKRKAHPKAAGPVADTLATLETPKIPRQDRLVSIQLVKSTLTSSGPTYETVGEARLRSSSGCQPRR